MLGNKSDLENIRAVRTETAVDLANLEELAFFETSALNGQNIDLAFNSMIKGSISVIKKQFTRRK